MRRTAILASAGAVALGFSLVVCVVPAFAQGSNAGGAGFTVDVNSLPKVKPYTAPRQIQIVNPGPKVTDCRDEEEGPQTVEIRLAPKRPPRGRTIIVDVPGGSGGGDSTVSGGDGPQTITLNNSQLPKSRFGTNIPAGGMAPRNPLQDGTTTNRMMGINAARGKMNTPTVTVKKGDLLRSTSKPTSSASAPTMVYHDNDDAGTSSFSNQLKTKTNVHGVVKSSPQRGQYLKPPH